MTMTWMLLGRRGGRRTRTRSWARHLRGRAGAPSARARGACAREACARTAPSSPQCRPSWLASSPARGHCSRGLAPHAPRARHVWSPAWTRCPRRSSSTSSASARCPRAMVGSSAGSESSSRSRSTWVHSAQQVQTRAPMQAHQDPTCPPCTTCALSCATTAPRSPAATTRRIAGVRPITSAARRTPQVSAMGMPVHGSALTMTWCKHDTHQRVGHPKMPTSSSTSAVPPSREESFTRVPSRMSRGSELKHEGFSGDDGWICDNG
mmetsp:Transcript_8308/g.24450  ORF Transcript_8308/g.24450 Transcript_8308/m.24450 type:complete len:265 (-) Transcript_8308:116-910(-)